MSEQIPFYRDRLGQAQRRRLETLIAVHRLFPYITANDCVAVAMWIIRGNPSARIPTVVSEQAAQLEKIVRLQP